MAKIKTFEELEAWQACRALRHFVVREILPILLEKKEFDLTNQVKTAARSTTNNIAEGFGRYHYRDNYRFCSIARGSLYEVLDHLIDANDEDFINDSLLNQGRSLFEAAAKPLNGYMTYLERASTDSSKVREPDSTYGATEPSEVLSEEPVTNNQ